MADELRLEHRVSLLERDMDVLKATNDLQHKDTTRRLDSIEQTSNANGSKLDILLDLKSRSEGAAAERKVLEAKAEAQRDKAQNFRLTIWVTAVGVIGGLVGCLIEAHWQIFP